MNGTSSPADTMNPAVVVKPSPLSSTGQRSSSECGPAVATSVGPTRRTQGTCAPYPKRMMSSMRMGTRPRTPFTTRTTRVAQSTGDMQSTSQSMAASRPTSAAVRESPISA